MVEIISGITEYLKLIIGANLYFGAFLAALIETIFPPIPSEVVMPLAGYLASLGNYGYLGLLIVTLCSTLGATIGAIIIYYASLKLGRFFILKYGKYFLINEENLSSAERWFEKYGAKAVFFGRMAPGIRELVSIPAGFSKMDFKKFLFYTLLGTFIWTALLVSLGFFLGVYVEKLNLSGIFGKIGIFLIAIILIYFIIRFLAKKFEKENKL
ncbi:MAG: DedA family protein [Nanoarchaeota archaeon]|nr:DedA family protein [Nanoarchaeota archaeon]